MRCLFLISATLCAFSSSGITLDESPAEPQEWGFRPAVGTVSDLNPPAFCWRPVKDAAHYVVEVAQDTSFNDVVYREPESRWSNHCPPVTLPSGELFWRYAAVSANGEQSEWSKVRNFAISKDATEFPQPTVDELVERLPEEHPRLFMRPDDLPRFQELASGDFSEMWDGIVERADKVLENPPDVTEPPLYPEGTVRLSEEWKKIWWGNRRRVIAVAEGAALLGFTYRISGEEKYAQGARELLLAMSKWDPEGSTQYRYNDEAAMPALYMTSRAYDWAYPVLDEADRAKIAAMMRIRGNQCYEHLRGRNHLWKPYASHSNRAWHFLGEVAIAFMDEIPEAQTWLDFSNTVFFTAYPVWGGNDGGWHEGTAYWSSYLNRFMFWAFITRPAFGIDVFKKPYFKEAGYYGMYILPPGTTHGGFSDQADRTSSASVADLMAVFASGAQNPYWKWYAQEAGASWDASYLDFFYRAHAQDLDAKSPVNLPTSRAFMGVGLAALNANIMDASKNVQLFFKSSPMGSVSHGYNANNAFHLNVGGKPLLQNTGRRDVHGSPHHKEWMWSTRSQNAILVNGQEQFRHSPRNLGRISTFYTSSDFDVVIGEAGASYENLNRWSRRIVFLKPGVFVIHDVLEATEPAVYDWLLHAPGQFAIDGSTASYEAENGRVTAAFLYPADLEITQSGEYDPPPHEWAFKLHEWHLTARTAKELKDQQFVTVLRVNEADAAWHLAEKAGHHVLTVTSEGAETELAMDADEIRITHGNDSRTFPE
jgi:hypothetical protein